MRVMFSKRVTRVVCDANRIRQRHYNRLPSTSAKIVVVPCEIALSSLSLRYTNFICFQVFRYRIGAFFFFFADSFATETIIKMNHSLYALKKP